MSRISRDQMFMEIAQVVAKRGTCDRAYVGAVLVANERNIVAIGYNGAAPRDPHCDQVGHLMVDGHCIRAFHAEENCIAKLGPEHYTGGPNPLTLYVTHYPCMKCTLKIVKESLRGLPITRIVYLTPYRLEDVPLVREKLFEAGGIIVEQFVGDTVGTDTQPKLHRLSPA